MGDATDTLHGTAVALGAAAALILGPSGSGKSDLALRCLALAPTPLLPQPPVLIADDRVFIERAGDRLRVKAPASIIGQIEVRGLGIIAVPHRLAADLVLAVELVPPETVERLPDPAPMWHFQGVSIPLLRLAPFEASAPVKLMLALMQVMQGLANQQET
ncbi:HPr kinase/phosphorylase [Hyphomicrobium sp. 1Nfss2.1]|uniref:HPr kinase/phosphorylase n=1 Tax=Hyphomicrobium sp. 1Nfss2.1 TaxID=3413936 RepID=UPI003C7C0CC2